MLFGFGVTGYLLFTHARLALRARPVLGLFDFKVVRQLSGDQFIIG
jgi:hypothetical protein